MTQKANQTPPGERAQCAELLSDAGVAALAGVEPRTVRLWRQSRGLPFIRVTAKVVRVRRADWEAWLAQHRVAIVV